MKAIERHNFTTEEDAYIAAHYSRVQIREIAAHLGRPPGIVQQHIDLLIRKGALDRAARFYHRPWSDEETSKLRALYGLRSDEQLARLLGRTPTAVCVKAKRLGVSKRANFLTLREVDDVFGGHEHFRKVRGWIKSGLLRATRTAWKWRGRTMWCILVPDLERFLREHPEEYDFRRIDPFKYPHYSSLADDASRRVSGQTPVRARMKYEEHEDLFILSHWERMTPKQIGERLGRSPNAIQAKATELRLAQHLGVRRKRTWRRWREADDKVLREHYYTLPLAELARRLDRTECAVHMRGEALGLTRRGWRRPRPATEQEPEMERAA